MPLRRKERDEIHVLKERAERIIEAGTQGSLREGSACDASRFFRRFVTGFGPE
jgi:hypothetical protein